MAAKIVLSGIEITVPTSELGEAIRQLAPWLPYSGRPAAAVLLPQAKDEADATAAQRAIKLLQLISTQTLLDGGATPEQVMEAIEAAHPKGIGSRMVSVNALLRGLGFTEPDVYKNDRNEQGTRVWSAGPKLEDALALLEQGEKLAGTK